MINGQVGSIRSVKLENPLNSKIIFLAMLTLEIVLKPVVNFVSSLGTISTPVGFEEVMSKNLSPLIV